VIYFSTPNLLRRLCNVEYLMAGCGERREGVGGSNAACFKVLSRHLSRQNNVERNTFFFFISPYSLYNQSVWQTLSTSCENDLFLETNTYSIT
jgi:hypothetical protein